MHNGRPRVIVADDDPGVLDQLKRLLEDEFEIISAVGDGQALFDAVQNFPPDVVVTDISMPVMDGLQATRRILKERSGLPVVILSVHEDDAYLEAAREAGALAYVIKRQAGRDLVPAIRHALSGGTSSGSRKKNSG